MFLLIFPPATKQGCLLTLRKIANRMSKNCQKIDKNCHFFSTISIGNFPEGQQTILCVLSPQEPSVQRDPVWTQHALCGEREDQRGVCVRVKDQQNLLQVRLLYNNREVLQVKCEYYSHRGPEYEGVSSLFIFIRYTNISKLQI